MVHWEERENNRCAVSPCWVVVDAQTGELIWWPTEALAQAVDVPLGSLVADWNMALSPDGKWLAATLGDQRVGHWFAFVIISLEDGSITPVYNEQGHYYLVWTE